MEQRVIEESEFGRSNESAICYKELGDVETEIIGYTLGITMGLGHRKWAAGVIGVSSAGFVEESRFHP